MLRLFLLFLIVLIPFPSFALVNGSSSNINTWQKNGIVINDSQGRSLRQNAKTVTLDDGSAVMVWEDERNGYTDIYAQRISEFGTKLWQEGGIAVCRADKNQTFPQVVNVSSGEIVVTWQDYRDKYSDIYAQKIDKDGNLLWASDGFPVCKAPANQLAPQLVSDGSGGAIITWYDYRSGKGEDIYAQKISATGTNEWPVDGVPVCIENGTQWYPQIISDNAGGAVICWDDKREGYYDIYAQKISMSGEPLWQLNGIPICSAPENQQYCQIAAASSETYIIAWQDYRNGNADIYAQRVSGLGRISWKNNGEVICSVAGNQEKPNIIGGDSPIILWTDYRNGTGNSDIFCNKISPSGSLLFGQYGIAVCESSGNQNNPKGTSDGVNGAIITWQDQRDGSSGIFARRISGDGKALWAVDGKKICSTNYGAEFPQISPLKNGNAYIVWQDKRNGGLEIYTQSVTLTGAIGFKANGIELVNALGSVTQQKPRVARVGKEEYLVVFEDYRNGYSNIYAQLFNNKGKLLWGVDGIQLCKYAADQLNPDIISDDDGGAIIVWEDMRDKYSNIYAQKMDLNGNKIWDENGILLCETLGEKREPRIAKDGNKGAVIAWQELRGVSTKIIAQKIDSNGNILWKSDGAVLSNNPGTQSDTKINPDGEGGAIVTWVEYRVNVNNPDIFAQRISTAGNQMWGLTALSVCKAPEAQRNPDVGVNGEVIIAWEDSGGGNYDIYAQKIQKDGKISWTCDGIPICSAAFTQHEPKLILNGDGGATITWEDYRNTNWDIYAQRIDNEGQLMWNKDAVEVCGASGTQYAPQIIRGKDMTSMIVWEDYRNNKSYGIYAQKLDGDGRILWEKEGYPICTADGGSRNPQIVTDGTGGAVIVWIDYRYGSYDIYAQRLNEPAVK
jgi:hypothetical protein